MNNNETMRRVYRDAQKNCGLNVRDYVKVIESAKELCCEDWGGAYAWDDNKEAMVGGVHQILEIDSVNGICLGGRFFPYFVLEKVDKPAHEFKPFERVLARDEKHFPWRPDIFLWKVEDDICGYKCCRGSYRYSIPYKGNEHLLGTTDSPEE